MNDKAGRRWILPAVGIIAVIFGSLGYFVSRWYFHRGQNPAEEIAQMGAIDGPAVPTELIGSTLPAFSLKDVEGQTQSSAQWQGKVLLINFWASWCPPCREEMPGFVELQKTYGAGGFQVVGVAIDDLSAAKAAAEELGVNYPVLVGDEDAIALSNRLGDGFGALPYSVLADRQGRIRYIRPGTLSKATLVLELKKLL